MAERSKRIEMYDSDKMTKINDETLRQMLVRYLAHIKEAKIMDDDTTLAVFISNEAKNHFMEKRVKDETN